MSSTINQYGMVELDSYSSSSSASSITVDIQTGSNSPRANLACVAGTLASTSTNEVTYFEIANYTGSYNPNLTSYNDTSTMCPYNPNAVNYGVMRLGDVQLNVYYQGNSNYNTSVSGERYSFIMWITDMSTNSLPYNNVAVTAWNAAYYPSYALLPHWAHAQGKDYGINLKIRFFAGSGSLVGRVKSWKWAGE